MWAIWDTGIEQFFYIFLCFFFLLFYFIYFSEVVWLSHHFVLFSLSFSFFLFSIIHESRWIPCCSWNCIVNNIAGDFQGIKKFMHTVNNRDWVIYNFFFFLWRILLNSCTNYLLVIFIHTTKIYSQEEKN